jgi:predicted GNAT family N-acyltransferase
MEAITIKEVSIHDDIYQQVYNLREQILRQPIGLSLKDEDLSGDAFDIILAAQRGEQVIGCVMLHPLHEPESIKLRQMAVADDLQGNGIGKLLVDAAEKTALEKQAQKIILHARTTAEGFYKKLGYHTTSSEFTEVGIPHVVMEKVL